MTRLFDIRPGEARGSVAGFAVLLMLVIGGHTILETARDALLLTGPGPRAIGAVYMGIAVGTVPAAAVVSRAGQRYGQRRTLAGLLGVAVLGPVVLFVVPARPATAIATYILSGILGSILVPQFWTLAGTALTIAQGRRLFGPISAAGIAGAVAGPAAASAALTVLPVRDLLLLSAAVFALAFGALRLVRVTERPEAIGARRRRSTAGALQSFRQYPFLRRVGLVVVVSTATFLTLDYLFKSTVARTLPPAAVAPFVAHYYLALNLSSLAVQLALTGPLVSRLGMLPALVLTPVLLAGGAMAPLLTGGAFVAVLAIKAIDGSLRHSMHRVTGELMYLPIPLAVRARAKPFIDGALARATQTATGAALLAVGGTRLGAPSSIALALAVLASTWLVVVLTMRRPYLDLLRSAVTSGSLTVSDTLEPLDLETAQMLVQRLGSEDALEVEGAMAALSRRGRPGLVSALVLLHHDQGVLVRALEAFGASARSDWFPLAQKLLADPREEVRVAAARALARHDQLDPASLGNDVGMRTRGYVAVRMALRDPALPATEHGAVAALLEETGAPGAVARLGMLAAIADSAPSARLHPLLDRLAREPGEGRERTELLASAASRQRDRDLVPHLVQLLSVREGREAVRAALVALGPLAFDEVVRVLRDGHAPPRLRMHLPKTLARFGSRRAAECLLEQVEREGGGLVRYKAIRALLWLVTERPVVVDRTRVEAQSRIDMQRHLGWLSVEEFLRAAPGVLGDGATQALVLELLTEKANNALQRGFQLLQIAHPHRGVHHAWLATRSGEPFARANAGELLDALLPRHDQAALRTLFRLATDELPVAERLRRGAPLVPHLPQTREAAVAVLLRAHDPMLDVLGRRLAVPQERTPQPAALQEARV